MLRRSEQGCPRTAPRIIGTVPAEALSSSAFGILHSRGLLRLIVRYVVNSDLLCVALACRAFYSCVEQEHPRGVDGKRFTTGVTAVSASISRLVWARDLIGHDVNGQLESQGPPWLVAWDCTTCAALAV
eukprot:SAG31_NODE_17260_length_677_cov_1.676471_1_plen_128_part_01